MVTRKEALAQLTAPGEPLELVEIEAIGRKILWFKNAPPTLKQLFSETRSDKPFLIYKDERLTFEEAWRAGCTFAHALVEDYGIKPGDHVAISMRNYPEWFIAFTAITSIGAVAVALNALWQSDEMSFGLEDCEAKILIADAERLERLAAIENPPKDLKIIAVRTDDVPAGGRTWAQVMDRPAAMEMPEAEFGSDDDAIMLYTSGSTGNPKGVISTHRAVMSAIMSWELDMYSAFATGLLPVPPEGSPQGCMLLGIPLFHVTGLHACYLTAYRLQRRVASMYKWNPAEAAKMIEAERITHFTAPSAVTGDLVKYARDHGHSLETLTSLGGGGALRAPEQVRAIDRDLANARPGTGWGMTETNAIGAGIAAADYLERPESTGRCSAVLEMRIVDPDTGKVLGDNQRGELQVRGASIMREYWKRPDANAEVFVDGDWLRTGDVAYRDEDEFIYIVDRIKDLVIRGGENIGCGAVEYAIQEHPAVIEACVYGVPDERLGEEVAATVFAEKPVDESELRAFLSERLAKFQIPRYFRFVDAPLPRGATGKLLKRQLREEAIRETDKALA